MGRGFAARHWYRLSPVSLLLYPVGLVFGLAVRLRRLLYRLNLLASVRLPVPVIVVGNLTVGGTGKTPLVLWLAAYLQQQGRRPAILCRGYGGTDVGPRAVVGDDDPGCVGDEPLLLALRGGCPVWIGRDRAAAGAKMLGVHPDRDIIICDDGLQHYRIQRDLEIAVEDERGHGNGLLLPAGPLREPAHRPVDARVLNGEPDGPEIARCGQRVLGQCGHGGAAMVFRMRLEPRGFYFVHDPARSVSVAELSGKRLHAVAGIGNPQRFFALLRRLGLDPVCHAFPDHHAYAAADLEFPDCDLVLMTEKDAVKCPRCGRSDLVALRVDALLDPAFPDFLSLRLHGRASA
ncbi:MAG: tetraacyldisaccharide 4'-kinase [Betaproteobacteria bacterium RBG_16_64_18]|nr:MAG: tetraacyldisaccharide 4'-kinase [Betaproteobacteria bacterium RBG_16_64_18]